MTDEEEFEEWWHNPHPEWKPTVYWLDRYKCAKDAWFAACSELSRTKQSRDDWKKAWHEQVARLRQTEEKVKELEEEITRRIETYDHLADSTARVISILEERVKELEAIERLSKDSIMSEFDRAEKSELRLKEFDLALQSLTPGGSEFVNDPERCVQFVKYLEESQINLIKQFKVRADKAESCLKLLRDAIDKHEEFKRTHEKVVSLEDEELYQARKEE